VPCCKLCNAMKSGLGAETFINHIKRVAAWKKPTL
jgi:hypothetical protein